MYECVWCRDTAETKDNCTHKPGCVVTTSKPPESREEIRTALYRCIGMAMDMYQDILDCQREHRDSLDLMIVAYDSAHPRALAKVVNQLRIQRDRLDLLIGDREDGPND